MPSTPPPGAVFVLILIVLVALGTVMMLALKAAAWVAARRGAAVNDYAYDMSSAGAWDDDENTVADVAATTATTQQQSIAMQQNDSNALLLRAKAEALAKMVKAGAIGETKGLHIVFGERPSSTNPRYLAARDALKAELARLEDGAQFVQPDGSLGPATYPVTGQPPLRTRVR